MWDSAKYRDNKYLWILERQEVPDIEKLKALIPNALQDCGLFLLRTGQVYSKSQTLDLMSKLGTPLNQSPEGCDIFEVKNEGYDPAHPKFRGPSSNRRLSFHTDRCDIITFHCVRQAAEGGINMFAHVDCVYEIMKSEAPEELKILEQPFFYKRHNADPAHPFATYTLPVFDAAGGTLFITLMNYLIAKADTDPDLPNLSEAQRRALDKLQEICLRPEVHLQEKLQPGDFLFLNNVRMLHSRTEFKDSREERLYYRTWLSVPWSLKLPESFKNLFGNIEAGSVRGGFKSFQR